MITPFTPAGEILSEAQVRSIVLADDPALPDGEYTFIDTYCTDSTCDCRKTIIQVMHERRLVSIIDFGWESPKFYRRWMGSPSDPSDRALAEEMSGVSIAFQSPDRVSRKGMLRLMDRLLDEKWISIFKEHYRLIRAASKPDNIVRFPKISRNSPCPCGSGKKHKHCCL